MNTGDDFFDLSEWDEAAIPRRSGLFRLEPQGLGTSRQESLLSYLIRVSHAHGVNPRLLVKYFLAERHPRIGQIATKAFFQTLSGTINGLGLYAEMFADVLGEVTVRQDLRQLAMLRWKGLLPHNGQALLARRPRWCPACLHEWGPSTAGTSMPLVWSLEPYQVCPDHRVRLADQCHACGVKQDFLPSYPDPGYCRRCRSWLGHGLPAQDVSEFHLWIARAVADMVAAGFSRADEPNLDVFRKFLTEQIAKHGAGSRTAFCRAIGLGDFAVSGWLNKGQRPSIVQFLTVCHGLRILPSKVFFGGDRVIGLPSQVEPRVKLTPRKRCPRPTFERRLAWKRQLEAELTSNNPSCLAKVARKLDVSRSCLRYWFPDLCKALSEQSRMVAQKRSVLRRAEEVAVLHEVVAAARLSGGMVSRRRLDGILRERGLTISRSHLRKEFQAMLRQVKAIKGRSWTEACTPGEPASEAGT